MSISSTPRAELDAQHVPAHSAVPKMRVPRSVRLRLRRQGRASQVRRVCSGSLALASLNLACRDHVPTFPQRSPPSLLTTAACGGLRSTPDCRPRRALLHLSYSCIPPCGPAILVTQDPKQTRHVREDRTPWELSRIAGWLLQCLSSTQKRERGVTAAKRQ